MPNTTRLRKPTHAVIFACSSFLFGNRRGFDRLYRLAANELDLLTYRSAPPEGHRVPKVLSKYLEEMSGVMGLNELKKMIAQRRAREDLYSKADYWDSKATDLEGRAASMWPNNHLNGHYEKEQFEIIREAIPRIAGMRVLDVGCGIGRLSRWLASQGAEVTGIDFSNEALEIARRATREGNPTYRHQSLFDIDEEEVYDILMSWGVLTIGCRDRDDLAAAMSVMHRALKVGGRMLLLEPVHRGFLHRVLNMSVKEFTDVVEQAGLEIELVKPMYFWPVRLGLAYVPWPGFITTPTYHLGHALMALPGLNRLGDYTAILASRKK